MASILLILQEGARGLELPNIHVAYLGSRAFVGIAMLIHMFFAQLFIGFIIGSPLLQWWGRRKGNAHAQRLSGSLDRFNIYTFSTGATFAGLFLVLIFGLYPRVTAALFTHFFWFFPVLGMGVMVMTLYLAYTYHYRTERSSILAGLGAAFFILIWQTILTGIDSFMVTGVGASASSIQSGGNLTLGGLGEALDSIFNPLFFSLDLHRTFGNLSWPAYAVAGWSAFMYIRSKSAEDKAFYDWAGSVGVMWGTIFLLLQPLIGFANVYSIKKLLSYRPGELSVPGAAGPYDRLVGSGGETFTSNLLFVNLLLVVGLFALSAAAMYLGATRHPDYAGRIPIRIFGLVAVLAGLYSISPIADWPFLYMRYIMMLIMVLATLVALVFYIRQRRYFEYGSPSGWYRAVLIGLGIFATAVTLNMGWMKSNMRVPYTIYGHSKYTIQSEKPIIQKQVQKH